MGGPRPSGAAPAVAPLGGVQARPAAVDPFGAAPAAAVAAQKKVTLVIDDSAVDASEIGRKSMMRSVVLVVIGIVVGVGVGWGVGGTTQERDQYNLALRDGKDIYAKVQDTSKVIETAQQTLKKAVDASSGAGANPASVDYEAVKQLVAMERPFSANEFHRRRYRAFPPAVVDDLFDYYNNINLIWDRFQVLQAKTAGEAKQKALNESAKAADGLIKTQYGAVLSKAGELIAAGLVYVTIPEGAAEASDEGKNKDEGGPKVEVASNQGGRSVEREVYTGQEDFAENYGKYVFMLDKARSRTILGESASLFAEYQAQLMELNALMTKVTEAQGRLTKELGKIAAMQEESIF